MQKQGTAADGQSRSTLHAWILFMLDNPWYFYQATGLRLTDSNVERLACELFGRDVRLFRERVKHYHPSTVIKGLAVIASHIGVTMAKIIHIYYRHLNGGRRHDEWKFPVWKESREYYTHKGRLDRWARHEGIGKYAKQSVPEEGKKARYLQAECTQAGIRSQLAQGEGKEAKAQPTVRGLRKAGQGHSSRGSASQG